MEVVRHSN
jgi:hypothetical protein